MGLACSSCRRRRDDVCTDVAGTEIGRMDVAGTEVGQNPSQWGTDVDCTEVEQNPSQWVRWNSQGEAVAELHWTPGGDALTPRAGRVIRRTHSTDL